MDRQNEPKKTKPALGAGFSYFNLADWTGLEPATSAVTGRHSNQLNYQSVSLLQSYSLFLGVQI